jgi:hypothetical protein
LELQLFSHLIVELKFTLFKLNLHLPLLAPSAWILVIDIEILEA